MRKKTVESLKTEAAAMVGMLGSKDGAQQEFAQAVTEAAIFYGYYRGLGHSEKSAAFFAKKAIDKTKG